MYQAIVKKGKVLSENVPPPIVGKGRIIIKVVYSCISSGTELSSVKESGITLTQRLLKQPQKIKDGIELLKVNGINKTIGIIKGIQEGGLQTGYSAAGIIIAIGDDIEGFAIGDRVAASGGGFANHAEYISVPENLVMKMPENVSFKHASTVSLGGIAMQGIRRAELMLGEYCVVTGAGILGLLTIQMLKASGIRVAAIDPDINRLQLAQKYGAEITLDPTSEDIKEMIQSWTNGHGTDAVIFTAATNSSSPLSLAFQMCRKKGHVVLVGVSGMEIDRKDIYSKELDFRISTSYGPGRYDDNYEIKGLDYPYAYVRWTENRNMSEYLRLISSGHIQIESMISDEFPIEKVSEAFESLRSNKKPIISLLFYGEPEGNEVEKYYSVAKNVSFQHSTVQNDNVNVALVGAGNFAMSMHLPNIKALNKKYNLYCVDNRTGIKANNIAQQYGAKYATSDLKEVLDDPEVDLILISTRHDSHADLVLKALKAGKNVFVEKPLSTNIDELESIKEFYAKHDGPKPLLMTGFNRRFSPICKEIKSHTDKRINPLFIQYRMNAGYIAKDHWVHENGGRIVGEACHLIDLMTFFTGSRISSISCESISPVTEKVSSSDNKSITLKYADGSVCNIQYFSQGNKNLSKEYMEVHFDGKSIIMDDYKRLKGYGIKIHEFNDDQSKKGQREELLELYDSLKSKDKSWPIELWDMIQTTETSILISSKC
ncbi:Gfo/Idh/MocA family oxidoreductase [Saccharicrinis sp. FJH54]|uniref:Gfo/Idh/MocA family oxidoreductase n=1 Tax=Saccharicrinis sp. FJH54 TaxID=3344665 RepID=UPI0035D40CF9